MKVLQVPFGFPPDPVGGTEVYVEGLARALREYGVESVVAAPGSARAYDHHGLAVRRFEATSGPIDPAVLYGPGDPVAARAFGRILDEERPDVVHLHAFTPAVSLRSVEEARRRDRPVVFTYHTPTVSCMRGTLLRWGAEVCDGALDTARCAGCALDSLGVARWLAGPVGRLPTAVGRALGGVGLAGGPWTAARMSALVAARHQAVRGLLRSADRVVALGRWTAALLIRLGVPPERLVVSPHGLAWPGAPTAPGPSRPAGRGPRLAALARLDPTKGLDLVIRALRTRPALAVSLDVYGVMAGQAETRHARTLRELASGDSRVSLRPPLAHGEVVGRLREYDALVVPSRGMETGPLVVLEAFAAGRPVLGAARGGIAELVTDGVDGLLVAPDSVAAWTAALERLAADPGLLPRLETGVRPPRRMAEVAADMAELYRGFRSSRPAPLTVEVPV